MEKAIANLDSANKRMKEAMAKYEDKETIQPDDRCDVNSIAFADGSCPKCSNKAKKAHVCPLRSQINDDDSLCQCCDGCEDLCLDEI